MRAFTDAFDAIPFGTHKAHFEGRSYILTKSAFSDGKSQKLVAEELGGSDYISLNFYRLPSSDLLKPCEMPEAKVFAFVTGLTLV